MELGVGSWWTLYIDGGFKPTHLQNISQVKLDHFPGVGMKIENKLKPPPSFWSDWRFWSVVYYIYTTTCSNCFMHHCDIWISLTLICHRLERWFGQIMKRILFGRSVTPTWWNHTPKMVQLGIRQKTWLWKEWLQRFLFFTLDIQTRYLDPKNIPKTQKLRRFFWMSRVKITTNISKWFSIWFPCGASHFPATPKVNISHDRLPERPLRVNLVC